MRKIKCQQFKVGQLVRCMDDCGAVFSKMIEYESGIKFGGKLLFMPKKNDLLIVLESFSDDDDDYVIKILHPNGVGYAWDDYYEKV